MTTRPGDGGREGHVPVNVPRVLKGFKEFLLRGNVIDLAVAVVIGAAFTAVVTAFTTSFLEPLLRLFSGGSEAVPPGTIPLTDEVQLDYAAFLNAIIQFFITAAVIYFLVVYPMKWLQQRRKRGQEEDTPQTDSELLTQIRDLLQEQAEREREREQTTVPGRGPMPPMAPGAPVHTGPAGQVPTRAMAPPPYADGARPTRHRG